MANMEDIKTNLSKENIDKIRGIISKSISTKKENITLVGVKLVFIDEEKNNKIKLQKVISGVDLNNYQDITKDYINTIKNNWCITMQDIKKEKTVVFDCETTGLSPTKNSIVSIGAIDVATGDTFYEECKVPDDSEVNPQALAVNGFTESQVRDKSKQTDEEAYKKFINFCKEHKTVFVAGYNVGFDLNFLNSIGSKINDNSLPKKSYDLMEVAMNELIKNDSIFPLVEKEKIPGKYPKLDETLGYYGIPSEPKPHNGLNGAKLECEVYVLMKYTKHYFKEYEVVPVAPAIKELNIDFENYVHDTSSFLK